MKHKKILLVANDNLEILTVQRELTKHQVDHSLHIAKNGLDALALLMGCSSPQLENYSQTGKVQPDIILMDAESPNLDMVELLCIMQKYYSLQKIRVYLMVSDISKIDVNEVKKYGVAGVVPKPFDMLSSKYDAQKLLVELGKTPQKAWLPIAAILPANVSLSKCLGLFSKVKYSVLHVTGGVAAKSGIATAIVVGSTLVGTSLISNNNDHHMPSPVLPTVVVAAGIPPSTDIPEVKDSVIPEVKELLPSNEVTKPKKLKKVQTQSSTQNIKENTREQKPERSFRIVVTEEEPVNDVH